MCSKLSKIVTLGGNIYWILKDSIVILHQNLCPRSCPLAERALLTLYVVEVAHNSLETKGDVRRNFAEFDIDTLTTNHNHEDIFENVETYTCVFAFW